VRGVHPGSVPPRPPNLAPSLWDSLDSSAACKGAVYSAMLGP